MERGEVGLCILITIGLFNWRLTFGCLLGDWFLLGDLVPLGTSHWLLGAFYTPLLRDDMGGARLPEIYTPLVRLLVTLLLGPCWETSGPRFYWKVPLTVVVSEKRVSFNLVSRCKNSRWDNCLQNSPLGGKKLSSWRLIWRSDVLDILTFWYSGHTLTFWCSGLRETSRPKVAKASL